MKLAVIAPENSQERSAMDDILRTRVAKAADNEPLEYWEKCDYLPMKSELGCDITIKLNRTIIQV